MKRQYKTGRRFPNIKDEPNFYEYPILPALKMWKIDGTPTPMIEEQAAPTMSDNQTAVVSPFPSFGSVMLDDDASIFSY